MAIINLNMNSVKSTASEVLDTLDEFFATELVAIEHGDEGDERETSINSCWTGCQVRITEH